MRTTFKGLINVMRDPSIILRIGSGLCFIAHGSLAMSGKAQFANLLGNFGLDEVSALFTLKVIGALDITVGLMLLFHPGKWVVRWAIFWTTLTVVAWGLHGDGLMDLMRRVTYITTPLALLLSFRHIEMRNTMGAKTISISKPDMISANRAIEQMDLSLICMKLMEEEEGEGWSEVQCREVAQEYRRYMKLKLLYPKENIVPNRAIDTMWHYHILDTAAYQRDCMAIFGQLLHHYPYFGMHGEADEKQFYNAFDRTKFLYEQTFSSPMFGPGYLASFQRVS